MQASEQFATVCHYSKGGMRGSPLELIHSVRPSGTPGSIDETSFVTLFKVQPFLPLSEISPQTLLLYYYPVRIQQLASPYLHRHIYLHATEYPLKSQLHAPDTHLLHQVGTQIYEYYYDSAGK